MREKPISTLARRSCVWLVLGVLLLGVACSYQHHTNMGNTEKWAMSDVNLVAKNGGLLFLPIIDAVFSPLTMGADQLFRDEQYHHDHKYLSYAGARTVARSDMHIVYRWWAGLVTIVIETAWLPLTGTVDLFNVLWFGDDGTAEM